MRERINFMAGLSINGNKKQNQKLQGTINNVKQYCDADAVSRLNKAEFLFDKTMSKREAGAMERNGEKYRISLPKQFTKFSPEERGSAVCHELSHVDFAEKNNTKGDIPSKEDELQAYTKEYSFKQKFLKDKGVAFTPPSKEKITEMLNIHREYRCIPDKSPTTETEALKAEFNMSACGFIKDSKDFINNSIFLGAVKDKK